ncbi:MAG: hypothetical protein AAGE59_30640 [Cyanobacteria bacterium P01_F01_bin.86]
MQFPKLPESDLVQALHLCIPNIQNAVIENDNLLKIKTLDGKTLAVTLEGLYKIINTVESNTGIVIGHIQINNLQPLQRGEIEELTLLN